MSDNDFLIMTKGSGAILHAGKYSTRVEKIRAKMLEKEEAYSELWINELSGGTNKTVAVTLEKTDYDINGCHYHYSMTLDISEVRGLAKLLLRGKK
ncbi:hypothetical protein HY212_07800 [Candidatus Pacearchaeota archaeon]|nr:hypothetical protein [Candidatus Pacearchaeota archaeon]